MKEFRVEYRLQFMNPPQYLSGSRVVPAQSAESARTKLMRHLLSFWRHHAHNDLVGIETEQVTLIPKGGSNAETLPRQD